MRQPAAVLAVIILWIITARVLWVVATCILRIIVVCILRSIFACILGAILWTVPHTICTTWSVTVVSCIIFHFVIFIHKISSHEFCLLYIHCTAIFVLQEYYVSRQKIYALFYFLWKRTIIQIENKIIIRITIPINKGKIKNIYAKIAPNVERISSAKINL